MKNRTFRALDRAGVYLIDEDISQNIARTKEGYLLCLNVPVARAGWLGYKRGELFKEEDFKDGQSAGDILEIYRSIEELSSVEALASFEGKTATDGHPEPLGTFVDVKNWAEFSVGHASNFRRGEGAHNDKVIADILITDEDVIVKILEEGIREVSLGYDFKLRPLDGDKFEQFYIRGNHVAIVKYGRNGKDCRIIDTAENLNLIERFTMNLKDKLAKAFGRKVTKNDLHRAIDEALGEGGEGAGNKELDLTSIEGLGAAFKLMADHIAKLETLIKGVATDSAEGEEDKDKNKAADEGSEEDKDKAKAADQNADDKNKASDEDKDKERISALEKALDELKNDKKAVDSIPADTLSRAEILAPGIKASRNIKEDALIAAAQSARGREAIKHALNGRALDSVPTDTLFVLASEHLKENDGLYVALDSANNEATGSKPLVMTAAEINAMNSKARG